MDIGRALTFFTEDERWVEKTAIGTGVLLLSTVLSVVLIGLLGVFIVMGYTVRLLQNVRDDVRPVLPEWDQWGDDLVRGIKLFVVQLVWALPIILIAVPIMIFSAVLADSSGSGAEGLGALLALCSSCLIVILALAYTVLQPGYTIAFARHEEIGDALQLSSIISWTREHLGDVVLVAIVYIVGSLLIGTVASIVGVVLCLIGLIVTLPLSQLVIYFFQYHLYGQLAGEGWSAVSRAEYGEEPDIPPVDVPPPTPGASTASEE